MVLSDGESSGIVTSPNYPQHYPVNVSCHYYIDGLVDKQNLEKVKLHFDDFDLPTVGDRFVPIVSIGDRHGSIYSNPTRSKTSSALIKPNPSYPTQCTEWVRFTFVNNVSKY